MSVIGQRFRSPGLPGLNHSLIRGTVLLAPDYTIPFYLKKKKIPTERAEKLT
uniref:Uncharacterized protein n=1 Tax=Anguilla anguilla TaxID=7936 RepID=A0A0E9RJ97_ANGAN